MSVFKNRGEDDLRMIYEATEYQSICEHLEGKARSGFVKQNHIRLLHPNMSETDDVNWDLKVPYSCQ